MYLHLTIQNPIKKADCPINIKKEESVSESINPNPIDIQLPTRMLYSDIKSLEDIQEYFKNYKFHTFTHLMCIEEIDGTDPISCSSHDVAYLITKKAKELGYQSGRVYITEVDSDGNYCGLDHTFPWARKKLDNSLAFYVIDWPNKQGWYYAKNYSEMKSIIYNWYESIADQSKSGIEFFSSKGKKINVGCSLEDYRNTFTSDKEIETISEPEALPNTSYPVVENLQPTQNETNSVKEVAMEDAANVPLIPSVTRDIESEDNEGRIPLVVATALSNAVADTTAPKTITEYDKHMEELHKMFIDFSVCGPFVRKKKANSIYQFVLNNNLQVDLSKNKMLWSLIDNPEAFAKQDRNSQNNDE